MRRKKSRKRSSFFTGILVIINTGLVLMLLMAYLANYVSPDKIWHFAFAGLALPFILAANLMMILVWLMVRPKYTLISLLTIAVGFNINARHLQLNYPDEFDKNSRVFRVASFNAHFYDIWTKDGKPQYETLDKVVDFFNHEKPDILCLQEGMIHHERTGNVAERVRSRLGYQRYSSASYFPGESSGLIIYHNGKLLNQGTITHDSRTIAVFADIELNGSALRVYSVHLQSNMLGSEEYVMDNLTPDAYKDTLFLKGSKQIARKLKYAFVSRAHQANLLRDHIGSCEIPVVVCGDFNDTPGSYTYNRTKSGLRDTFMKAGKGMGRTYRGKFPSFRIDYILTSKSITTKSFHTANQQQLSDHYPVFAWLELPETAD